MTLQIPAALDDLAVHLAARVEERLAALTTELEHAGVVAYEADEGLATRGGIVRMTLADVAAVVAQAALDGFDLRQFPGMAT
jgi:hypothetical protein